MDRHGLSAFLLTALAAAVPAAEFRGITAEQIAATFPYSVNEPIILLGALSGDGSTIGGAIHETGVIYDCPTFDCGSSAYVWDVQTSERRDLGRLPLTANTRGYPIGVKGLSFDGSQAIVLHEYGHYESALHAGGAVMPFRDRIGIGEYLTATAMSSNAEVVVGQLGAKPFRWTAESGLTQFGPDGYAASAVSGDGSIVLLNEQKITWGLTADPLHRSNGIVWTDGGESVELQPLSGYRNSLLSATSDDGRIVVGSSQPTPDTTWEVDFPDYDAGPQATVWIDGEPLALSTPGGASGAADVSADGSSIVGYFTYLSMATNAYFYPEAMLWRGGKAYQIKELLAKDPALQDAMKGWRLTSATSISDDGTIVAGQGIAPDGRSAVWIATLPVPEPGTAMLVAVASAWLGALRRRR